MSWLTRAKHGCLKPLCRRSWQSAQNVNYGFPFSVYMIAALKGLWVHPSFRGTPLTFLGVSSVCWTCEVPEGEASGSVVQPGWWEEGSCPCPTLEMLEGQAGSTQTQVYLFKLFQSSSSKCFQLLQEKQ